LAAFKRLFTILVEKWLSCGRASGNRAGNHRQILSERKTDPRDHRKTRGGRREKRELGGKGKGRDIGYALAVNSCEGAGDVESCTITAFDVITAFAVPYPGHILAD
jgi:hypothetical protein